MPMLIGRRELTTAFCGVALWPLSARAQEGGKKYTIAMFGAGNQHAVPALNATFFAALKELGWVEGKNVVFEYRYAENRLDRLPELAADLVRHKVDVIATAGTLTPLAAKRATATIPIVMIAAGDPLGSGLVANLAQPGGNVTGLSLMASDLGAKRIELLKEVLPRLSRVAVLWNADNPYALVFKQTQAGGRTLGIEVRSLEVRGPDDFGSAFETARGLHPDALITVEDPLTTDYQTPIAEFTAQQQLPSIHGIREFVVAGGLISYGASLADLFRRAAYYVDKILRGARPADLPVQQPTKFEMVVNLKTAKALGLELPAGVLSRADELIE
jgi:putative tryptophan/tyrosine transport system substrate-binding protein